MASITDICNLALAHLGDPAEVTSIDPPDGSVQASHCARFYPIARDEVLEMHPWHFAVKRADLAEVDNAYEDDWSFAYALPSGCLRPLSCLLPGVPERFLSIDTDAGTHPYIVEAADDGTLVLYTNVETATLRYIARITDSTKFTPGFVTCLARRLASYLAGPIVKGANGAKTAQEQMRIFAAEYAKAAAMNANVGRRTTYQTRRPDFLAARGLGPWPPDAPVER
jgi:hypothetical protein